MSLRVLVLLLMIVVCGKSVHAETVSTQHVWSALRLKQALTGQLSNTVQLQHRYTFTDEKLFEEQLNTITNYRSSVGDFRVLLTLGTVNGYERLNERRLGLEYEKVWALSGGWKYSLRFRQELRNFEGVDDLAHRFRVRNQLKRELGLWKFDGIYINNELNYYMNDYIEDAQGLSSVRTIVGLLKGGERFDWSVSYLNDYRNEPDGVEVRNVLFLSGQFE